MPRMSSLFRAVCCIVAAVLLTAPAFAAGKSGTTLAASKTLDICVLPDGQWRLFGEVSVWNEGTLDTAGFTLDDCIQNKVGNSFVNVQCGAQVTGTIPAGTTLETATVFPYTFVLPPLTGDIRNAARAKILNHSGSLNKPTGPEPKATWFGGVPQTCATPCQCALSQGYWKNHLELWPAGFDPNAAFFQSGSSWSTVLNTSPGGNKYYILAHQYIAMVLNQASGTCLLPGVKEDLDLATGFFTASTPLTCGTPSACGLQATWAAVFDSYIHGGYVSEGGPEHCGSDPN